MRHKTVLAIFSLAIITVCFGYFFSRQLPVVAQRLEPTPIPLNEQIDAISVDELMLIMDEVARQKPRGTVYGGSFGAGTPKIIYEPLGENWGTELRMPNNLTFRDGLVRKIIENVKNNLVSGNIAGGNIDINAYSNEIVAALQSECNTQCNANYQSWNSNFRNYVPTCTCGDGDSGYYDCACSHYNCGYGSNEWSSRQIYSNVCTEFHCATTAPRTAATPPPAGELYGDNDGIHNAMTLPYSEASFEKMENQTALGIAQVCGWDTKYDVCQGVSWQVGQPAPTGFPFPGWCEFRSSADQQRGTKRFCTNSDFRLMCLQHQRLSPQLLAATNTTLSYLADLIGTFSPNTTGGTGFLGAIQNRYSEIFEKFMEEMAPNLSGGTSAWDQTPANTNYASIWNNQTGECYNYAVGGCSCADVLPINSKTLTNAGLQNVLNSWKVENPTLYCVNGSDGMACDRFNWNGTGVSWGLGKRNIFSARASYPGIARPDTGEYYQGGLCVEDDKSSGSGDGGTDSAAYTDADFWFYQARYHEDTFRISFPMKLSEWEPNMTKGQRPGSYNPAKYNDGQEKLLGDYGGCDDRSNILFSRNTTAACEEKKSSSPKCEKPSDEEFSSWACAEDGSVIDQCKEGFANGRNTSCQVCGPILCGERGMFSDVNTVRKNLDGTDARHYGYFANTRRTSSKDGVQVSNIDGTQIPSYRTIGCEGGNCDFRNRGDLSQIANYYGIVFDDSYFGGPDGQVIQDRTCESVHGAGWIVDPCSQVDGTNDTRLNNNWNGDRKCYTACCKDSDYNGSCDEYEKDQDSNYIGGTCPSAGQFESCSASPYDQTGNDDPTKNNYQNRYLQHPTCIPSGTVRGARDTGNSVSICEALGATDWRYGKPVGAAYDYTLNSGANCYTCGCGQITSNNASYPTGKSGWWASDTRFQSNINSYDACAANGGLTPEEKCRELYPVDSARPEAGYQFSGLAYARDQDGTNLLRGGGAYGLARTSCVRCRCVADDGICDGCYPSDPIRNTNPNFEGSCYNFENGMDPDCGGTCPDVCDPEQCNPGTVCTESCLVPPNKEFTLDDSGTNGQGCGYCIANTCNNNGTCEPGESCSSCRDDCGACPNAICPDGYGALCEGDQYSNDLPNCRRCLTPGNEAGYPGVNAGDCDPNDGYCNPLCENEDADCDPIRDRDQCPVGYSSGQEGCGGPAQNSNSPLIGSSHPLQKTCCTYGAEQCTPAVVATAVCVDQGGIDWVPMLRAQQQQLYQSSFCYGYQLYTDVLTVGNLSFDSYKYDYYQKAAWMINPDNVSISSDTGGYRRCRPPMMPEGGSILGSNSNCEVVCVPKDHNLIVMSCSEIDARYPDEFGFDQPTDGSTYIFLPDMARSAGNRAVITTPHTTGLDNHVDRSDDKRCGRYYRTYSGGGYGSGPDGVQNGDLNGDGSPDWKDANEAASYIYTDWWQAGGSAYGNTGVGNYGEGENRVMNPGDINNNPATSGYVQNESYQYALTGGTGICAHLGDITDGNDNPTAYDGSLDSGLQVTGTGNPTGMQGYRTYRSGDQAVDNLAATRGYTYQATQQRPLDWQYYTAKFDYYNSSAWTTSGNLRFRDVGGATVYKFGEGTTVSDGSFEDVSQGAVTSAITQAYNGNNVVIFIDGDFVLDANVTANGGKNNGYLALIIRGDLIIKPAVGYPLTNPDTCALNYAGLCTSSLDAVVIAQGLKMETARNGVGLDSLFNKDNPVYCDNQLVLSGSYSFWGDQPVVFTRSLLGCGFKKPMNGGYPNNTDTLNMQTGGNGEEGSVTYKNSTDQYCRTSGGSDGSDDPMPNDNGYWDYKPYATSGMYNNYNRLFPATQIISNPTLINKTPDWMRENSNTRLEVQ